MTATVESASACKHTHIECTSRLATNYSRNYMNNDIHLYTYSRSKKSSRFRSVPVSVPFPFRFTMDKRGIFFIPFRPFSLLSRACVHVYIERSTDRSIDRARSVSRVFKSPEARKDCP